MKAVFVVNPVAGGGRGLRAWRQLEVSWRGADCRPIVVSRRAGVGGDGTIPEAVNGLVDAQEGCPATLGIISAGTGNDFSKLLGYPRDPPAPSSDSSDHRPGGRGPAGKVPPRIRGQRAVARRPGVAGRGVAT